MKQAFLQSIRDEYPNEEVTRLVFADWCSENEPELEHKLRIHFPIIDRLNIRPNYGSGYGYGSGSGYGNGYGYGSGYGSGHVYGYGSGHIYGSGSGSGSGSGYKYINSKLNMPKLHSNQLIFLTDRFIVCGYVQKHIQPYQFKLTNVSFIHSHNSTWEEVANNANRNINSSKFGTITIGPQFFHSMDWEGELP